MFGAVRLVKNADIDKCKVQHQLQKKAFNQFRLAQKKNCLSLHYNEANSYLFVNGVEIHKFKAKDSEVNAIPLCVGNISKGFSVDNMKKTGLNGYVYAFSVDYDAIVDYVDFYCS